MKKITLRQAMKVGLRGGWGMRAYEVLEKPYSLQDLFELYGGSDRERQALLEEAFPDIKLVAGIVYNKWPANYATGLLQVFHGLEHLDEEMDDPHKVNMITGGDRV
jgi:hypothetical protein